MASKVSVKKEYFEKNIKKDLQGSSNNRKCVKCSDLTKTKEYEVIQLRFKQFSRTKTSGKE